MTSVSKTELFVRWGECDPAGIVYHPAYIDWFSVARMEWLKQNGLSYMESFHDAGIVIAVLEVRCTYKKTLRAEDKIVVEASVTHLSRTRMGLQYRVFNEHGDECAEGITEHVFLDEKTKPTNMARKAPELWERLHALVD